uniref:Ribosomal protein S11 n=1 Tax=Pharyngomonas kirbyi TaxID=63601 RepID=A0A1W6R271_9EUKA|nr:ribosomal protein S11 [Pharyngomonas kirbyi]ARO47987.1 ribosomal protein S11 [Pharyngomonas kirbyi]
MTYLIKRKKVFKDEKIAKVIEKIKKRAKKKGIVKNTVIPSPTLYPNTTYSDKINRFLKKRRQRRLKKYINHEISINAYFTRVLYKVLEGGMFLIAEEGSILQDKNLYTNKVYFNEKIKLLKFAKILRHRFNIEKDYKSKFFWSPKVNFLYYFDKHKHYNKVVKSYKKPFKKYKGRFKLDMSGLKLTSRMYLENLVNHYKSSIFDNPSSMFNNSFAMKWGKVNAYHYKKARLYRYMQNYRHNYLYFNISVLRYIKIKSYSNKVMKVFLFFIRKKKKFSQKLVKKCLLFYKKNLFFLMTKLDRLYLHVQEYKTFFEHLMTEKAELAHVNKKAIFITAKYRFKNIKEFYLSFLKRTLVRYFRFNIHLKFQKSNIFITVSDYRGDVEFRQSIGSIGYKKDKKKTYYAAKDLIRKTFPRLFHMFLVKTTVAKYSVLSIKSKINSFYFKFLNNNILNASDQIDKDFFEKETKLAPLYIKKIMYHTMKKYLTLRIILRGSKSKLRGLMRKIFKSLRFFKKKRKKLIPRILFLALNTKPHNGCRNPKKGRRKTKRRRQRMRVKLLNRKFEYEQKFLKRQLFKERKNLKMYKMRVPRVVKRNMLQRDYKKSLKLIRMKNKISNIQGNFFPIKNYTFLFPGPRRKGLKAFLRYKKKFTRKQRIWKDSERWTKPRSVKPSDISLKRRIKKKPIFYSPLQF